MKDTLRALYINLSFIYAAVEAFSALNRLDEKRARDAAATVPYL